LFGGSSLEIMLSFAGLGASKTPISLDDPAANREVQVLELLAKYQEGVFELANAGSDHTKLLRVKVEVFFFLAGFESGFVRTCLLIFWSQM
jgi:hypothetical protein